MFAVDEMLLGKQQYLARLITLVERDGPEVPEIMKLIQPRLGRAYRVGLTGPPGAGKSSMADRLTAVLRSKGLTVGVVCVDPTSPFSGGAVLGDRIRMQQHYLDEGVFIRSMATRGSLGGLPRTARGVVKLLDAFGKDFIIVETVGVGQTEMDVMEQVDTVVVVLVPEAGDTIQTMKAGLMEIADIFTVNKADRPGSSNLIAELQTMLHMHPSSEEYAHHAGHLDHPGMVHSDSPGKTWEVPVLATEALNNVGIEELYQKIEAHHAHLQETGLLDVKRREQRRKEFMETVEQRITGRLIELIQGNGELTSYVEKAANGEIDPYSAAQEVLGSKSLLKRWSQELSGRQ
ncbi:MAG: methylmalonyl Co-A mutase-associated GTPase MeaB [Dehalococcoidia bacterium]|nr:methylmalonyl Co-A mutase-associated GTPase MeaB [Dehalococcoidia bacterium]